MPVWDDALSAFKTLCEGLSNTDVRRNEVQSVDLNGKRGIFIQDGSGEVVEQTIGQPNAHRSWVWTADLTLVVEHDNDATRTQKLVDLWQEVVTVVEVNRTLSGTVDGVFLEGVDFSHLQEDDGGGGQGLATIQLVLEYGTTDMAG